jgi:hypothetical protein
VCSIFLKNSVRIFFEKIKENGDLESFLPSYTLGRTVPKEIHAIVKNLP